MGNLSASASEVAFTAALSCFLRAGPAQKRARATDRGVVVLAHAHILRAFISRV